MEDILKQKHRIKIKIGDKYNRLTILEFSHADKRWRKWFKVRCDCGVEKVVMGSAMTSNNTHSCGCYMREIKRRRIPNKHSEITAIILGYKRHARNRGYKWLLSRDIVEKIIKEDCYYCGSPPSNKKKTKDSIGDGLSYSGIDRINSHKDYTEHNVVACCKICNLAKRDMSLINFKEWAIRIGKKAMAEQWGKLLTNHQETE